MTKKFKIIVEIESTGEHRLTVDGMVDMVLDSLATELNYGSDFGYTIYSEVDGKTNLESEIKLDEVFE